MMCAEGWEIMVTEDGYRTGMISWEESRLRIARDSCVKHGINWSKIPWFRNGKILA